MITQNVTAIDEATLNGLVLDRASESATVDFKAIPHEKTDAGKLELAKDVCAFANAEGGDIFLGVASKDYTAAGIKPIENEPFDALARRLTEALNARIEPRVQGVLIREVRLAAGGYVAVVRVPSSFDGPHSIRISQEARRFVVRNGVSTTDMSFDQIRTAFDRTATLVERASAFMQERLLKISARHTSSPIMTGPVWVLHISPLVGISGKASIDLNQLYADRFRNFVGDDWSGGSRTFNFDGLTIHPGGDRSGGFYTYAHVFRNGTIECACIGGAKMQAQQGQPERAVVWSLGMSKFFWERANVALGELKHLGFTGPALMSVALLTAEGYELGVGNVFKQFSRGVADRSDFIVPPVYVEDIESMNLSAVLRPMLDSFWQIFDMPRCLDFDQNTGEYSPRSGF